MTTEHNARWCIVQTSPGRTLPLLRSLLAAGFDVWTPQVLIERRRPRSTKVIDISAPILPTILFADAARLGELAMMSNAEESAHPRFAIFRWNGFVPIVAEPSLAGLRQEEAEAQASAAERIRVRTEKEARLERARTARQRREAAKQRQIEVRAGDRVTIEDEPAFAGTIGVVQQTKGKSAIVLFGNAKMTIETWQLVPFPV